VNSPDAPGAVVNGRLAFYNLANYFADPTAFDDTIAINTPITSDILGNLYFGFQVLGANPLGLQSGIARISLTGVGSYVPVTVASGNSTMTQVVTNCAPALSNDQGTLYVAVSQGDMKAGYLLALNSTTLATESEVFLRDPNGNPAGLPNNGTASPTVAPTGEVYFGVLENPFPYNHGRGWLLHFSANLATSYYPGSFGWDDTASIIPATMVPSYHGASSYLVMSKYNDYADPGFGGTGLNEVAILDPSSFTIDPTSGGAVMAAVLTQLGPTPDPDLPGVKEWCINAAAVDPYTDSVLVNSEDGRLYRWNLASNTLTQAVTLTPGIGEAYTPTVIGADGTVYAINNATLFAVGQGASTSPTSPSSPPPPAVPMMPSDPVVVGAGAGGGPEVKVIDAQTGAVAFDFAAYAPNFTGGVRVALADVNGDGVPDIITAPGPGGGPDIRVFDGTTGAKIQEFLAYAPIFTGGVRVAVGDVNGDGIPDIITGPGPGGGPNVRVFSGQNDAMIRNFMAYSPRFAGGVYVASADLDGDGFADIITGAGAGGGPEVEAFSGATGAIIHNFMAFSNIFLGGVRVATVEVNGAPDLVVAAGPGGNPLVEVLDGTSLAVLDSVYAYNAAFGGGVYIGGA
jgi:hypothetical protein